MKKLLFILCLCLGCSALAKATPNLWTDGYVTYYTSWSKGDTLKFPPWNPTPPGFYSVYSTNTLKASSYSQSTTSTQQVNLTFNQTLSNVQISVCNTAGAVMYQNKLNVVSGSQCAIDVTGWAAGSYVLRIHVDGGTDDVFYFDI